METLLRSASATNSVFRRRSKYQLRDGSRSTTSGLPVSETPLDQDDPDDPYTSLQRPENDVYQTISNPAANTVTVDSDNSDSSCAIGRRRQQLDTNSNCNPKRVDGCSYRRHDRWSYFGVILQTNTSQASTSQITGYGNVTAAYGRDAHYRCTVANPAGVLQVTWQRLFKDESIENLATYSKRFGVQVNKPYKGKVIFEEATLNSTSIILKNVKWEDDSCYICSFNVYPDGSKRKTDLPHSASQEDSKEVVFSCSAIGKPAPTIHWSYPPDASALNQPHTTTITNSDHTFTSSRNVTLRVPRGWSGHVDCLLNRGVTGERLERISYTLKAENTEQDEEAGESRSAAGLAVMICAALFIFCIAVVAAVKIKRFKTNTRSDPV
ncbi:OX-2 membrane glycoprotein [Larimichthys crocea]|uniref:Uncharacterized protein n=1 Tax=Larimichthys crocea TaxID=215358 RepID=A0ACD3QXJ8_LARCR|nr:OX-2 membrane glycoprotein [Larimichthys crocea]